MRSFVNEAPPSSGVIMNGDVSQQVWEQEVDVTYQLFQDFNLLDKTMQQDVFDRLKHAFGLTDAANFYKLVEHTHLADRRDLHAIILDMLYGSKDA